MSQEIEEPRVQIVPPSPLPEIWQIDSAMFGAEQAVIIQVMGPYGVNVHFLGREAALKVASDIRHEAQTGPRLATPPSGLVIPK